MRWTKVNNLNELDLDIDGEYEDTTLSSVVLEDYSGRKVKIGSYYGLSVHVEAPPKVETWWQLVGEFRGLDVDEVFKYEVEARTRLDELTNEGTLDHNLFIYTVDVAIDPDTGKPVDENAVLNTHDDIPF